MMTFCKVTEIRNGKALLELCKDFWFLFFFFLEAEGGMASRASLGVYVHLGCLPLESHIGPCFLSGKLTQWDLACLAIIYLCVCVYIYMNDRTVVVT